MTETRLVLELKEVKMDSGRTVQGDGNRVVTKAGGTAW